MSLNESIQSAAGAATPPGSSLRKHPQLKSLFRAAQSRHLTEQELDDYCATVPLNAARADAAREVAAVEEAVVKKTLVEIFELYPFEKMHGAVAPDKCFRDVSYVSSYATLSMLMNDPNWFGDKFLIWMGTIIRAFYFTGREEQKRDLFAAKYDAAMQALADEADKLPDNVGAIFTTYSRLKQNYQAALSPQAWNLMEPVLQQSIDVLSAH